MKLAARHLALTLPLAGLLLLGAAARAEESGFDGTASAEGLAAAVPMPTAPEGLVGLDAPAPGVASLDLPEVPLPEGLVGFDAPGVDIAQAAPVSLDLPEVPLADGLVGFDAPSARLAEPRMLLPQISLPQVSLPEVPLPEGLVGFAAPDPLAPVAAEVLRLAEEPLHRRLGPSEIASLSAFYEARGGRPLWVDAAGLTPGAHAILDRLARAGEDGLDPIDYGLARTAPPLGERPSADALAQAELRLSSAAALYARDARGARVRPSRLSALVTPKLDVPMVSEALAVLADAPAPGEALAAFNPDHPGYRRLKALLAMSEEPKLRGEIIANLERWRWLPRELGTRHILVNTAAFTAYLVRDGAVAHQTRVVVGKPENPTPIFSDAMEYLVVNPSWGVPPGIARNEYLPRLREDPMYLAKRGIDVVSRGKVIDPATIDWTRAQNVAFRQPPGERNALGALKFIFPNDHAVYLHDTPSRGLFARANRALSHGCVRVENPFRLAALVLAAEPGNWTEARLKSLVGRGERHIKLTRPLPIHLAQFTLTVDEDGRLTRLPDLYGLSRKVRVALGLGA